MNSGYSLVYSKKALKQLKKLDKKDASFILGYIEKTLMNADDPRSQGKALTGNKKGLWRYRIGNYRAICEIDDGKLIVLVLSVGHRREVYK